MDKTDAELFYTDVPSFICQFDIYPRDSSVLDYGTDILECLENDNLCICTQSNVYISGDALSRKFDCLDYFKTDRYINKHVFVNNANSQKA